MSHMDFEQWTTHEDGSQTSAASSAYRSISNRLSVPSTSNILFFDPRLMGHHMEFLHHVASYGVQQDTFRVHLVVHPHVEEKAPSLVALANAHPEDVVLHPLTEQEFAATERTETIFQRAIAGWEAAAMRARRVKASHCVFMEVNAYQPVLGLPRARRAPFQTSGILFFPYCRLEPASQKLLPRLKTHLETLRKRWQLRWVLSNPTVQTLFLLNDPWGARQLNEELGKGTFASLPDPVPFVQDEAPVPSSVVDWANRKWDGQRTHVLLFGSLRRAKGVLPTLQAFRDLPGEHAARMSFHLLGRSRDDLTDTLSGLVDTLRYGQPRLKVHFEDRYLSESELSVALDRSDLVLAPYLRTEGSSGVLGHAASHRLPVIGPRTGLIGQLIESYALGTALERITPATLREALMAHVPNPRAHASVSGMQRYADERTPTAFARTLTDTLLQG